MEQAAIIVFALLLTWVVGGFIRNSAREGQAVQSIIISIVAIIISSYVFIFFLKKISLFAEWLFG